MLKVLGIFALVLTSASCQCGSTCVAIGCDRSTEILFSTPLVQDGEYVIMVNPLGASRNTCDVVIAAGAITHTCESDRTELLTVAVGDAGVSSGVIGVNFLGLHEAADVSVLHDGASLVMGRARLDHWRASIEGACDTEDCRVNVLTLP
jgi:hypothetical protein